MKNKKTVWAILLAAFLALSLTACSTPNGVGVEPPESIELTSQPTKVKYNLGDDIDLSGMVLKANFKDGTTKEIDIKDVKISGYDKDKRGNQTVTITYGGISVTFDVNVIDPSLPLVATPTASPGAGDYHEAISVTLSCDTEGAEIYYTLDGTIPTEKNASYSSAISITTPTTLKAFAVKEDMNDSVELVAEYTFSFAAAPVLSLVPDSQKITYTWTASDPEADSYDVFWKAGSDLSADEVKTGEKIAGASSGGTITGLVNNTAYSVIVTANKAGYPSVDSAVQTATPVFVYIIMGGDGAFTATKAGQTLLTDNQQLQTVIDAIRTNANGDACIIQFGDGDTALDIGTASVSLNNTGGTWGPVELRGKITGSVSDTSTGVIAIANAVSVTSIADITNTAASNGRAIYNNSTGALTISSGTVSSTNSSAVYNASTGAVNVSGGTVSATSGTAVYNYSTGVVSISGGTISSTTFRAVYMNNASAKLTLGGSPEITGRIRPSAAGQLTVASGFSPGAKTYTLEFASFTNAFIAVTGGANYLSNFTLYNPTRWALAVSGNNIVLAIDFSLPYIITGSSTSFTATQNNGTVGTANQSIQNVLEAIRTDANGGDCTIQFGNGTTALDTGYNAANFSGNWGLVTLTGKITGINVNDTGVIAIADAVSVTSTADITNNYPYAGSSNINRAVYHNSTGELTISGGTVSAAGIGGIAVYNYSTGKITVSQAAGKTTLVTSANTTRGTIYLESNGTATAVRLEITGGTVQNTADSSGARAIYNASAGAVNISGGTVSTTTGTAIRNNSNGAVNISGGTVSVTVNAGTAVYNDDTGALNISGGTVSATTGYAVYNSSTGKITISQAAGAATLVTSATTNYCTIYLNYGGTNSTAMRLEITGGTVSNTSTTTGRTIYNNSAGWVNITGGTVSKAGDDGYALYRGGEAGRISVGPGATIVGNKSW